MSRWKIIEGINYYFITTTIVEWQNVFMSDELFEVIITSLKHCIDHKGLHLHAYVIMPNHVHYIVSVDPAQHLSDIMRDFNRFTSCQITRILEKTMRKDLLDVFQKAAAEEGRGNTYKV
jgi:putative transposase